MAKKVGESQRFVVGWGRKNGRIVFFIKHKELRGGRPIPCNPEDLQRKMVTLADEIDRDRGDI